MKYTLGFVNRSRSTQDWAIYLDKVSIAQFSLPADGGSKYVPVEMKVGDEIAVTVSADQTAAATLTVNDKGKLILTSHTPRVWDLEQETGTQYVLYCTLS